MSDHLRFSGKDAAIQRQALREIVLSQPVLTRVLDGLEQLALPDHLLVAGAIYNVVWNELTGRPPLNGVNDIDVCYFDSSDLSWDAEDKVIKTAARHFFDLPLPLQIRNQARVHLWFEAKFRISFPPLKSSREALERYASKAHAVGLRRSVTGELEVVAPFGLDDLFSFRMVPNPVLDNRATHTAKAARAKAIWPEITVVPWPD